MSELRTLETLQFDNTFARLPEVFYAKVMPTPLKNPCLVAFNPDAAALLDLDPEEAKRPEFAGCFAGHYLPPGTKPLAMVYAGHQFGAYVSRLGDGRAILLGEVRNGRGEKWDLHLKGAASHPSPATTTAAPSCARASGSTSAARPCTGSAFPRRAHCAWWGARKRSCASRSRPAPRCCASRLLMSGSATSSSSTGDGSSTTSRPWRTTCSRSIFPSWWAVLTPTCASTTR